MSLKGPSFLSLLEKHEHLSTLFLLHQEALLSLDIDLAVFRLGRFERELLTHISVEEDLLMPVYARAGRIRGGPIEFYIGEHKRMLEFLARFNKKLEGLKESQTNITFGIIELFDQEAQFKQLMQHHDSREQKILYPTLDSVTNDEERKDLLARCHDWAAACITRHH